MTTMHITSHIPARQLAAQHLGKQVSVTTEDGANVTDTLVHLLADQREKDSKVFMAVGFEHIRPANVSGIDYQYGGGAFRLELDSIVAITEDVLDSTE